MFFLQEVASEDFELLMQYMYTGEVAVEQSDLVRVFKVAEKLKIRGLMECSSQLQEKGSHLIPNESDESDMSEKKTDDGPENSYVEEDSNHEEESPPPAPSAPSTSSNNAPSTSSAAKMDEENSSSNDVEAAKNSLKELCPAEDKQEGLDGSVEEVPEDVDMETSEVRKYR